MVGNKWHVQFARKFGTTRDLIGIPLGHTDIQGLALAHDVGKSKHRFFEWSFHVVAVCLIQIDVIHVEALE